MGDRLNVTKPQLTEVQLSQIDFDDESYIVAFKPDLGQLAASIKNVGVLYPLILEKKTPLCYRIVCGYKRLLVLKQLMTESAAALCFESENFQPSLSLFQIALFENIGSRQLNLVEKAHVVHKLKYLFEVPDEKIAAHFLPFLELGHNPTVIERLLKISVLEDYLKQSIIDDFVTAETAFSLSELEKHVAKQVFDLFVSLKIGKNNQREFLQFFRDISKASSITISNIMEKPEIQAILRDEKLTAPVKINRLKDQLKKLRYPRFSVVEEKFDQFKKSLKLPPSLMLRPPAFFEGEKFSFELNFKNQAEFKKLVRQLNQFAEENRMKELEKLME